MTLMVHEIPLESGMSVWDYKGELALCQVGALSEIAWRFQQIKLPKEMFNTLPS